MAWIAWTKGLTHRAEVLAIADKLSIDPKLAAACCMLIWEWADDETEDGSVTNVTLVSFFRHADSVTGLRAFGEAFASVGWIVEDVNSVRFPNWDTYNGTSAKKRLKAARRAAKSRIKRDIRHADSVTKASPTEHNRTVKENLSTDSLCRDKLGEQKSGSVRVTDGVKRKPRKPNPVWDALAAMFFPDGVAEGDKKRLGKVVRDLDQMHATPEEINRRADVYVARMPDMPLTLEALRKNWGTLGKVKKHAASILDLIQ